MFKIDKTMMNPNIPITIRFTGILYDWLQEVSKREEISLNSAVLYCCKYSMEHYQDPKQEETKE